MSDTSPRNQDALRWDAPKRSHAAAPTPRECLWVLVRGTDTLSAQLLDQGAPFGFDLQLLKNGELVTAQRCETQALGRFLADQHRTSSLAAGWTAA